MDIRLEPKDARDAYSTPIVQQTAFWSGVKRRLGIRSRAFEYSVRNSDLYCGVGGYSRTNADFIMFYQFVNREDYIAYLPYGPEVEPSEERQGAFLEELSEQLRPHLGPHCIGIRYDLNWRSHWCREEDFDSEGLWRGAPKREFQEMQLNFSTRNWNLRKSNTNVLPADTILLDLNEPEEVILGRMKPKTRYNIRLALKKGIEVRDMGAKALPLWYGLYRETALRNGLHLSPIRCFQSVVAAKLDNVDPSVTVKLLLSYAGELPLAAMFLVLSAGRATYLYGASSSLHRELMPTYALQWQAIRMAKTCRCSEYDLFGVAPNPAPSHPMYGLLRFKQGFGGSVFHQLGCWDYPLQPEKYAAFSALELSSPGYYA